MCTNIVSLFPADLNDRLNDVEVFQSRPYDLIQSRFIFPGIKASRWATYIGDLRLLLRRGGWVQVLEYYPLIQSDNGRLTDQSAISRWWQMYAGAMQQLNRDPRIGRQLQQLLTQNGFRDVSVDVEQLPIGDWHSGKICPLLLWPFCQALDVDTICRPLPSVSSQPHVEAVTLDSNATRCVC
jgi:hypothetical protein